MSRDDSYWKSRCVDCHRRIGRTRREFYVWGAFLPMSTVPIIVGPLHEMHLRRYGHRIWGWT
jgi:hypothetical protein